MTNHMTNTTYPCAIIPIAHYHNTRTIYHTHTRLARPTRDLGPNPPRYPDRLSPNYVELAMYLDDVSNDLLAVRHNDTLSDILTPTT